MIYAENIFLCITAPVLLSLFFLRKNAHRFVVFFLIGMGMCLTGAYITGFVYQAAGFAEEEAAIFIAPVAEEIQKLLPLLFFLVVFSPSEDKLTDAAIGIGVGFATFENCCYILTAGAGSLPYILVRGLAVGVMHLVTTLAESGALNLVRRYRTLSVPGVVGALSLSMTFHALYNLLVSEPGVPAVIGYMLPLLAAVCLYIGYRGRIRRKKEEPPARVKNVLMNAGKEETTDEV